MAAPPAAPPGADLDGRPPPNPVVWLMRVATAVMIVVAVVGLWRRFRSDPAQEELIRYSTLTVPAYLEELARLHGQLERLQAPGLGPEPARALLVDELMPQLVRMRRRAEAVRAEAPAVRESNAEYLAALDAYLEMDRAAVRAIDDPAAAGEAAHRDIVARRRQADDAVRGFLEHLKKRCELAGLKLVPGGAGAAGPAGR